jgi:anaerobic sulfite reductase subunit B
MAMPAPLDVAAAQPGPMVPAAFEVVAKRQDTEDTWTLELESPLGSALAFAPGQFTMLSAFGTGEVPISISGDPDGEGPLVHTVRAVGLATRAICDARPGDVLGVRGPCGRPWPVHDLAGADALVVAGGVGLAPLRSAIVALLAERDRYGRLALLYGGRSPDQLLYEPEMEDWIERGLEVLVTVDSAGPEWLGNVGVVPRLIGRIELDWAGARALVCGPEVMMRFAVSALKQRGMSSDRISASFERNMQCAIGHCGHCQLGPTLLCRDGPVYSWSELEPWLAIREL